MLGVLKNTYYSLPSDKLGFIRYIPDRLLFGKSYYTETNKITTSTGVVQRNLFEILAYSQKYTQYGRENIRGSFDENDVFELLKSLPLVTSDHLSGNLGYYKSDEFNKLNSYITTTGGTGRFPTTILLSNNSFGCEWAYIHDIWSKLGYKKNQHIKLTLRGKNVPGKMLSHYNPLYNEIVVDTFRLKANNFLQLIDECQKYSYSYIHGYPSLVKEFIYYCELYGYKPQNLRGVFLGSEEISEADFVLFKKFFNCPVAGWYGQSEKVVLAYAIDTPDEYTVYPSYGYPFILNPDKSNFGEIVGTTFINRALPLINYSTGDYGIVEDTGEKLILKNIKGRWGKDFVYLDSTKRIPTTSINIHGTIQTEILFYQIHQHEYGRIVIKILPKQDTKLTSLEIINAFKHTIDVNLSDFEITYSIVDDNQIVRSKRNKKMMLVQDIKRELQL